MIFIASGSFVYFNSCQSSRHILFTISEWQNSPVNLLILEIFLFAYDFNGFPFVLWNNQLLLKEYPLKTDYFILKEPPPIQQLQSIYNETGRQLNN